MLQFTLRRILYMIPTLVIISILSFIIIQLPPGDYLTSYVTTLRATGETVDEATLAAMEQRYGLGKPMYVQYWKWISGILLRGDFGQSFEWNQPVSELMWGRLGLTFTMSLVTLLFTWLVAFPVGILSAVRQYSIGDYISTVIGYVGLATPNFLLALILMYIAFRYFNQSVGGLFSPDYADAPFSWAKVWDLLKHLWIPVIIIGTAGTAGFGGLVDVAKFCGFLTGPKRIAEGTVRRISNFSNANFSVSWTGFIDGVDGQEWRLTEVYQLTADAHDPNNSDSWVAHVSKILLSPRP